MCLPPFTFIILRLGSLVLLLLPLGFTYDPVDSQSYCQRNATAQTGMSARLFCCLAIYNSDLTISWVRQRDLVILSHGTTVFTSDSRVKAVHHPKLGIWELRLGLAGEEDSGSYQCQSNAEPKQEWMVNLQVKETRAEIAGPKEIYLKSGSQLNLMCRVNLGPDGPDQHFRENGVLHWFQNQRLIDPVISNHSRVHTSSTLGRQYKGWLSIERTSPGDSGNYSCVPSYTTPDWVYVHIIKDESGPAELHDGNSPQTSSSFKFHNLPRFVPVLVWMLSAL